MAAAPCSHTASWPFAATNGGTMLTLHGRGFGTRDFDAAVKLYHEKELPVTVEKTVLAEDLENAVRVGDFDEAVERDEEAFQTRADRLLQELSEKAGENLKAPDCPQIRIEIKIEKVAKENPSFQDSQKSGWVSHQK